MTEFRLEMLKIRKKLRTYIGPAGMLLLIVAVLLGMKYGGEFKHVQRELEKDFIVVGSYVNAAFMTRLLLDVVTFTFLPLFACMVFGDLLASESADGTVRSILTRPVSRRRIVAAKYAAGVVYTVLLTFGTGVVSYLLGWMVLGHGSLVTLNDGIYIFNEGDAVARLARAYALLALSMIAVGSIAFAISSFLSNSNGAIGGAVGFLIGTSIISQFEFFAWAKPYLFVTYMNSYTSLFKGTVDLALLWKGIGVTAAYSAVLAVISLIVFRRKDVLS